MRSDVRLIRSPLSVAGMVLTTLSAVLFLVVFLADLFGLHTNPYLGILFFLVLPAGFGFGLILIPMGAWIERRRRARGKAPSEIHWPRIDLNDPAQRRTVVLIFALTMANVVIVSLAAYRGVEYMDSVGFCGQVCHSVMKPEFVAYQDGPHARVTCVQCHIGPGASWFARSKVSGTRQVFAVLLNTYSRPIPSPVENLRPARDTCEQCHWPEKFHGDTIQRKYQVRGRRAEHRDGHDAAGACRGREPAAGARRRHSLAYERGEPRRVHRRRRPAAGDSVGARHRCVGPRAASTRRKASSRRTSRTASGG